jgi:hypothetical protein
MLNGTSLIISSKNQKHLIISHHSKQGVLLKYYKINFWYRYEIPLVVTSDREVIWLDN